MRSTLGQTAFLCSQTTRRRVAGGGELSLQPGGDFRAAVANSLHISRRPREPGGLARCADSVRMRSRGVRSGARLHRRRALPASAVHGRARERGRVARQRARSGPLAGAVRLSARGLSVSCARTRATMPVRTEGAVRQIVARCAAGRRPGACGVRRWATRARASPWASVPSSTGRHRCRPTTTARRRDERPAGGGALGTSPGLRLLQGV